MCLYVKDPDGRFLYINRAGAEAVGRTPEEMIGRLQHDVVGLDAGVAWQAQDLEVLRSRVPWDGEEVHGETTFMTHKVPLFDAEGRAVAVVGASTDITAGKREEDDLRRSEARLSEAQQIAGVGSWHWDPATQQVTWSPELYRIYGLDPAIGPTGTEASAQLVHPDDLPVVEAATQATLRGEGPMELDLRVRRGDGEEIVVHCRAAASFSPDGALYRLDGTCADVTERRRADARLAQAQRLAQLGSWDLDVDTGELTWSEETYRIFGVEAEHFIPSTERLHGLIADEDRARFSAELAETISSGAPLDILVRAERPDGEVRELRLRGGPLPPSTAQSQRLIGICQDLTDLRRSREDLAEAVALFRRSFEDAPVGMGLAGPDGRFMLVNDALCVFLGRSAAELAELTVMDVIDPGDVAETDAAFARMASGDSAGRQVEKRYVRPDGSRVWGSLRASVINDSEGRMQHCLAVIEDITDRRLAEARRAALHGTTAVMAAGGALSEALPAIAGVIGQAMSWGEGTVWLEDPGAGLAGRAWRARGALGDPGGIAFPLLSGNAVLGVIAFTGVEEFVLTEELMVMAQSLGTQIGEFVVRKRTQEELAHLALHDPLTGLPNRVLFHDRLDHALRRSRRGSAPLAVLFLDFDGFKAVNDRFGHAEGDEVLQRAAARVRSALRADDTVARFGGDELVILSENVDGPESAARIAQRVLEELRAPFVLRGEQLELSASIGVCLAMEPGRTREQLIHAADTAMYRAKADGPGGYVIAE